MATVVSCRYVQEEWLRLVTCFRKHSQDPSPLEERAEGEHACFEASWITLGHALFCLQAVWMPPTRNLKWVPPPHSVLFYSYFSSAVKQPLLPALCGTKDSVCRPYSLAGSYPEFPGPLQRPSNVVHSRQEVVPHEEEQQLLEVFRPLQHRIWNPGLELAGKRRRLSQAQVPALPLLGRESVAGQTHPRNWNTPS